MAIPVRGDGEEGHQHYLGPEEDEGPGGAPGHPCGVLEGGGQGQAKVGHLQPI